MGGVGHGGAQEEGGVIHYYLESIHIIVIQVVYLKYGNTILKYTHERHHSVVFKYNVRIISQILEMILINIGNTFSRHFIP